MNIRIFKISLLILFLTIGGMILWTSYSYYTIVSADDPIPPSLYVEDGKATVIRGEIAYDMIKDEKLNLESGDIIETKVSSRAVLTWPDRSITRIGENSRIIIKQMYVSNNYDRIQISYDIKRGKVWNTLIRTMIGDSYFEARLPKNGIVAGVRGTIFEINLDSGYIHAVDHMMQISDISGRALSLLPGEIIDSENIWIKKGKEILDNAWGIYNTLQDTEYYNARIQAVRDRVQHLSGDSQKWNPIDRITRWILSYFAKFRDIEISNILYQGNTKELDSFLESEIIRYYQSLGGRGLEKERESIRKIIRESSKKDFIEKIKSQIFWDSIDMRTFDGDIRSLLESSGFNIEMIQKGGKEGLKKIRDTLTGSIDRFFRF